MIVEHGQIVAATILVVDDDRDIRLALTDGLQISGVTLDITSADSAVNAIQAANATRPDVIILDYNMPLGDGFLVAKEVRQNRELSATKIIMLTAQDTPEKNWESVEHQIDAFIGKPFDLTEIEAHIYSLLTKISEGHRKRAV